MPHPPAPVTGHDLVYRAVIRLFRVLLRLLGVRFDLRGVENIPTDGPVVLVCNHISYLDFALVQWAACRRGRLVRFMAKQSVFDAPVAGRLMHAMHHVPVDRANGAAAYRRAARLLAAGEAVGIFPEATISRSFTLKTFKPGAAALAVWEQVPLVPVVGFGAQRIATTDGRVGRRRGVPVVIRVGAPITAPPDADRADVEAELRRSMDELLDESWAVYPDRPRDRDDAWWLPAERGGSAPSRERAAELETQAYARRAERKAAKAAATAQKSAALRGGRLVRLVRHRTGGRSEKLAG